MTKTRDKAYLKAFGDNLRKLREIKKLSQEELCHQAGFSKNQIGNIERGEVNTSITSVYILSVALKVAPADLFNFEYSHPV
ncbi:helix-turn-helix domain-containing protein [Dyadobacter sp. CY312]|uniref:helix-turn-helix domain-containing protein n=1 Tax=Dyadobacter sp. CY312 TaxID=2907303 RepID=UPI001F47A585|nr:helix-turn-helix transcriptional regulator [Dyadobacter sp. CY312]MCE7043954.1 helix-turn-helix domain-containing protein [Dyadobacter sp. CY312]